MLKDPDWLLSHVRDPQMIAPGLREPPSGAMSIGQAQSVLSYIAPGAGRSADSAEDRADTTPRRSSSGAIARRAT